MKRDEPPAPPELPYKKIPVTLTAGKSRKWLILAVVLVAIVIGVIIFTYVMSLKNR